MEEIRKMLLKPGDVLVVKLRCLLHWTEIERIHAEIKKQAGDIPVVVVDVKADVSAMDARETTRYIEKDMNGYSDMAWECEVCEDARIFEEFHPSECDFNYCPKCGRKITEFVKYVPESEEGQCG